MRAFAAAYIAVLLLALFPAGAAALVTCRDRDSECTLQELIQLDKDAEGLGLSKAEHIAILLEIITHLRRIITSFQASSQVSYCVDLKHNMVIGSTDAKTNGEVSTLQAFLDRAGVYGDASITGVYGLQTAQAVLRWQQQLGIPNVTEKTGVGPFTRQKIKESTCALVQ
jgi:hypothetical protein